MRSMHARALLALAIVLAAPPSAEARIWRVIPGGGGDATTIAGAVALASSADSILVAAGTYRETGIVIDGKNLTIDATGGKVYCISPVPGSGTCLTFRNVTSACNLYSLYFRGYATAVAVESGSPQFWWITMKACGTGLAISDASSTTGLRLALIDSCTVGVDVQAGFGVIVRNETIVHCATGVRFAGGAGTILDRSIIYGCGIGAECTGGAASINCNDFFNNGTNYSGCSAGANDISLDPKFCFAVDHPPEYYYLHTTSPCLAMSSPCNPRIGAFNVVAGCTCTDVRQTSWGAIKSLYR